MITIVDYQMGNLRSVQKGIERVGGHAKISSEPQEIASAEKLILPGVGAFGDAMAEIHRRNLATPIVDFIRSNRPFLGICLGLQLLFERGFENGEHEGLGILGGDVVRFDLPSSYKVPHMGWNTVTKRADVPLLANTTENSHFYFVHSYYVRPADPSIIALECDYGGKFCAMVQQDNLFATQFHPEKSQTNGLQVLKAFEQINQHGETATPGS
ncbi:MAG: imidazole glycerol phosphate synthase subunit HisH [Rhodopirellula sp.]|nr:imidazole glycerol phosphate synthase subunit HisH [Rhodopirellula sp.]OUX51618.1 MAG: imidazole glycerol phosphate synthase subunit HisH [Rhodopirellula sp. TMED283]